jgi:hypothetical protein
MCMSREDEVESVASTKESFTRIKTMVERA